MVTSAALLVKKYFETYIRINIIKTKQDKYKDQPLARMILALAYDIVHEMDFLIRSNNANDLLVIKQCLRKQVTIISNLMKERQGVLEVIFHKNELPPDFGRCIHEAWHKLQRFEQINQGHTSRRLSNFTPRE